jgi:uncharacterized hydantoinase/oxoprolinase family protein
MNQKQRVFNMLAKTSKTQMSKSRKVNFALTDDLRAAYEDTRSFTSEISRSVDAAFETVVDLISRIPDPGMFMYDVEQYEIILEEVIARADSAAADLGVDPTAIDGYNSAKSFLEKEIPNLKDTIGQYEREIAPILKAGGF